MSELIERVGDAFLSEIGASVPDEKTVIIEVCILRSQFDAAIRAAISAMREPTEAMVAAASNWDCEECDGHGYQTAVNDWRAMIDAALADPKAGG